MSLYMLELPTELLCIFTELLWLTSKFIKEQWGLINFFRQLEVEKGYYLDGEDAKMMRKFLVDTYNLGVDEGDVLEVVDDEPECEVQESCCQAGKCTKARPSAN